MDTKSAVSTHTSADSATYAPGDPWRIGAAIRCPRVLQGACQGQSRLVTTKATGAADMDGGPEASGGLAGSRIKKGTDISSPSFASEEAVHSDAHVQLPRDSLSRGEPQVEFNKSESFPIPHLPAKYNGLTVAGAILIGGGFLFALFRTYKKLVNPKAVRSRMLDKNKFVVQTLDSYLPQRRTELTSRVLKSLAFKSGFKPVEIFRKYLWYLLRERQFDQSAVDDMVYLKGALNLSEDEVAEALKERGQRVYSKYGNVMLDTTGMTQAGIERKATSRALFSKLLYLSDCEQLLSPGGEAASKADVRNIFGATEEDADRLRIVSLYELDLNKLEGQFDGLDEE